MDERLHWQHTKAKISTWRMESRTSASCKQMTDTSEYARMRNPQKLSRTRTNFSGKSKWICYVSRLNRFQQRLTLIIRRSRFKVRRCWNRRTRPKLYEAIIRCTVWEYPSQTPCAWRCNASACNAWWAHRGDPEKLFSQGGNEIQSLNISCRQHPRRRNWAAQQDNVRPKMSDERWVCVWYEDLLISDRPKKTIFRCSLAVSLWVTKLQEKRIITLLLMCLSHRKIGFTTCLARPLKINVSDLHLLGGCFWEASSPVLQ
jgi:hypothetical protein